jgi:hypothetical protein
MNPTTPTCPPAEGGHGHRGVCILPPVSGPLPSPVRVTLTPDQTAEIVREAGGLNHFGRVWVTMSPGSYPTGEGRLVLHFIECPDMATVKGALRVAVGEARAVAFKAKAKGDE